MLTSVRVAGHTYEVRAVPDLKNDDGVDLDGQCDHAAFVISIREGHPQQMRTTLWHEILHAALPRLSEKTILAIERATYAVLSDNPGLLSDLRQ